MKKLILLLALFSPFAFGQSDVHLRARGAGTDLKLEAPGAVDVVGSLTQNGDVLNAVTTFQMGPANYEVTTTFGATPHQSAAVPMGTYLITVNWRAESLVANAGCLAIRMNHSVDGTTLARLVNESTNAGAVGVSLYGGSSTFVKTTTGSGFFTVQWEACTISEWRIRADNFKTMTNEVHIIRLGT